MRAGDLLVALDLEPFKLALNAVQASLRHTAAAVPHLPGHTLDDPAP